MFLRRCGVLRRSRGSGGGWLTSNTVRQSSQTKKIARVVRNTSRAADDLQFSHDTVGVPLCVITATAQVWFKNGTARHDGTLRAADRDVDRVVIGRDSWRAHRTDIDVLEHVTSGGVVVIGSDRDAREGDRDDRSGDDRRRPADPRTKTR